MALGFDFSGFRAAASRGDILWRQHALERMAARGIARSAVKNVLIHGTLIEGYPDDRPFPSGLFMGIEDGRPLHVVAALDAEEQVVFIVTAYEPGPERFEPDHRTRREG